MRRVWERHDFALPCTEGDAEVVTVFEGFFLGRGRSLLAGQEQFADVTVEYGDFLSTMRLDVFDFELSAADVATLDAKTTPAGQQDGRPSWGCAA